MEVPITFCTPSASFFAQFESKLTEYEQQHQGSQRKPWTEEKIMEVMQNLRKARKTLTSNKPKTPMDYYWCSKYDIVEILNREYLVFKKKAPNDPIVRIVPRNEYFNILQEVHESCSHGGRDKMIQIIKSRYYIPKKAIEIFLAHCPTCEKYNNTKKHVPKKQVVTKTNPIVYQDFNIIGQVHFMDFQSSPDGEYMWLLSYQDNATKFIILRLLKGIQAREVATELLKIFMIFGAPYILQSDNDRELTTKVIEELNVMWPECEIVLSSPGKQTDNSVETSSEAIENMLRSWMCDNNSTIWSLGCHYVQYRLNTLPHPAMGRSPYKAVFGGDPKSGSL